MKKLKRIAALICVILWGIMIFATVITAFINTELGHQLFKGLIYTDFVLPVVIYAMMLAYKFLSKRRQR